MLSMHDIKKLQASGKIKGFTLPETAKKYSTKSGKNIPKKKAKAFLTLITDLWWWSKENGYKLETEYKFDSVRKWRFDFCFPQLKVAIEYEGIFSGKSRHTTMGGYLEDTKKYNRAAVLGWRIIRVTANNAKDILQLLKEMMK